MAERMRCTQCGGALGPSDAFCGICGTRAGAPVEPVAHAPTAGRRPRSRVPAIVGGLVFVAAIAGLVIYAAGRPAGAPSSFPWSAIGERGPRPSPLPRGDVETRPSAAVDERATSVARPAEAPADPPPRPPPAPTPPPDAPAPPEPERPVEPSPPIEPPRPAEKPAPAAPAKNGDSSTSQPTTLPDAPPMDDRAEPPAAPATAPPDPPRPVDAIPPKATDPPLGDGSVLVELFVDPGDPRRDVQVTRFDAATGRVVARRLRRDVTGPPVGPCACVRLERDEWHVFPANVRGPDAGDEDAIVMHVAPETAARLRRDDRIQIVSGIDRDRLKRVPPWTRVEAPPPLGEDAIDETLAGTVVAHLDWIGGALRKYRDEHGALPPGVVEGPDGKPWHSWRVLLLPALGHRALHEQYDFAQPWDGASNRKLLAQMPPVYRDPSDDDPKSEQTRFVTVVGKQTALTITRQASVEGMPRTWMRGAASEFRDGEIDTIAVGCAEVRARVPWTAPRDPRADGSPSFAFDWDVYGEPAGLFLFANLHVERLRGPLAPKVLRALLTRDGDDTAAAAPRLSARIELPTGVRLTLIDGHPFTRIVRSRGGKR